MKRSQHSCRGCSVTWSGMNYCHCSKCHNTFTTPDLFDLHRRDGSRGCIKQLSGLKGPDGNKLMAYDREREVWTHAA